MLIGGEAGAGKTRLATELAQGCHAGGAAVVCGLCDSDLSLPYQPWVMALGQLVEQLPNQVLEDLRDDLAPLRVLVPSIERHVSGLIHLERLDPEAERYRMFSAVAAILQAASDLAPVLLVLDDLHWAGHQTLALLRFVTRSSPVDRLLIVGTFRDTGDEITDPLASLLADLRRVESVTRVKLEGIGPDAVFELLSAAGAVGDLEARAAAISERTGGNPFLVSELSQQPERSTTKSIQESVPESVLEVVAGRRQRLSPSARELATVIAVGGRVEFAVLRASVPNVGTEFEQALDELLQSGLVRELVGTAPSYHFGHALIRDAVNELLPAFSRTGVHHRLALAIERTHEADRRLVLAELARHFAAASPVTGWDKAVYYGRRAANQARLTAAYDEAIELLEITLDVVPDDGVERASLLVEVAALLERCGRHPEAVERAREAYAAAERAGDLEMQGHAAVELERASHLRNGPAELAIPMFETVLASSAELPPDFQARLRASLARARFLAGDPDAFSLALDALDEARAIGDDATVAHALEVACVLASEPLARLRYSTELGQLTATTGNIFQSMWAAARETHALISLGRLIEAGHALSFLRHRADTYRFVSFQYESLIFAGTLALTAGRFGEAEAAAEAANVTEEARFDGIDAAGAYGVQMFMVRREQGRLEEMRPILQILGHSSRSAGIWRPGLLVAYAELDMLDEARAGFAELAAEQFRTLPRDSVWPLALAFLSDACMKLRDSASAAVLFCELESFAGFTLDAGFTTNAGPADRYRAAMAQLSGKPNVANELVAGAAEFAEISGSPVWRNHVERTWSWIATEQGDQAGARTHLASARRLADEYGLQGADDRSLSSSDNGPDAVESVLLANGISQREAEVLALLAVGHTNRSIADALFISPNTAANHVRSLLRKTGSANRTEAAGFAIHHGLVPPDSSTPPPSGPNRNARNTAG